MTKLGLMLKAYEQKHDLSGRKLAEEIGINKSTFCRIKQGKMPDAHTLTTLLVWMLKEGRDQ